jgi:hypothetical protein
MLPYLLASLPAPRLGATPPIEIDAFLDACRRFLSEERIRELAAATHGATAGSDDPAHEGGPGARSSAAARAWAASSAALDDQVVRQRCARDRRDPGPYLRAPEGLRIDLAQAVTEAFASPHPGTRERALDQLRWHLADELATTAPLGFEALYARAVQLGIAWRWERWDVDAGWAVLEAHLRRIEQDVAAGPDGVGGG